MHCLLLKLSLIPYYCRMKTTRLRTTSCLEMPCSVTYFRVESWAKEMALSGLIKQAVFALFRRWRALFGDPVNSQTEQLFIYSKKVKETENTLFTVEKKMLRKRRMDPLSSRGDDTVRHTRLSNFLSWKSASAWGWTCPRLPPETCSAVWVSRATNTCSNSLPHTRC